MELPDGGGRRDVDRFVASPRSYIVLSASLSGCRSVSNGVETTEQTSRTDDHFDTDLLNLVGG
jgi:hypothetical protein